MPFLVSRSRLPGRQASALAHDATSRSTFPLRIFGAADGRQAGDDADAHLASAPARLPAAARAAAAMVLAAAAGDDQGFAARLSLSVFLGVSRYFAMPPHALYARRYAISPPLESLVKCGRRVEPAGRARRAMMRSSRPAPSPEIGGAAVSL